MREKYVAYVGSYTRDNNNGITIYDMDVEKGRIYERAQVKINNASYITLSKDEKYLYAIADEGVAAYCILPDGNIELMNLKSINGMRGCHLTVTSDNNFLFVSGYHDGKITVMRLKSNGGIDDISDEVYHQGMGSIAERNFRPHVSCSVLTPDEELLCACDKGIDQIKLYEFNKNTGKLKLYDIIRSQLESAPKEMIFSADGRFAYVVCELKNYINVYSYNQNDEKNKFEFIQNIFTVRSSHKVNSAAANIVLSPDGKYLICSNAGDNTVTMYNVNQETGKLSSISSLPLSGDYPKFLQFFPDGKHIVSMNNNAGTITDFSIYPEKGLIVMNGPEIKISKPNNMVIKKL